MESVKESTRTKKERNEKNREMLIHVITICGEKELSPDRV